MLFWIVLFQYFCFVTFNVNPLLFTFHRQLCMNFYRVEKDCLSKYKKEKRKYSKLFVSRAYPSFHTHNNDISMKYLARVYPPIDRENIKRTNNITPPPLRIKSRTPASMKNNCFAPHFKIKNE